MNFTTEELAGKLGLEIQGEASIRISTVCGLTDNLANGLSFISSEKFLKQAEESQIPAFIVKPGVELKGKTLLFAENPDLVMIAVAEMFSESPCEFSDPVHPSAVIGKDVTLGEGVLIGANCVIGDGVTIGDGTRILPGTVIMDGTRVGADCLFYANVTLYHGIEVGDRVIIHSGSVVGSDGYGFYTHEGVHRKIPQIGTVVLENDVELGANCSIDRGRFTETRIGEGTKLDNLVHLAHNVKLGKGCLLTGQVGIAGSTTVGNYITMGGQSGIVGHLNIPDGVTLMGKSLISGDLHEAGVYAGIPARPANLWRKATAQLYRLAKGSKKR